MPFSIFEFKDLLKPQLEARGDLSVLDPVPTVYTVWPVLDYSVSDAIILGYTARATRTPAAVGRNRVDEEPELDCQIRVMRAGAGEVVGKAARDRAAILIAAVDNELRTNHPELSGADDHTFWARISDYEPDEFPDPGDAALRICVITFQILYKARVSVD